MESSLSPSGGGKARRKPPAQRRALTREIKEEEDPLWRNWFAEVERRKKKLTSPKNMPFVIAPNDKDGAKGTIERRKSVPTPVKSFLKKNVQKAGVSLNTDILLINAAWKKAVAGDIAENTEVFSFKNGALIISVYSSSLLQEIRQFHQEAILQDLRDIWLASQPLVKITYRLGKR